MKIFPEFDYEITKVIDTDTIQSEVKIEKVYFKTILRRDGDGGEVYELPYYWHYCIKEEDERELLRVTQMFLMQAYAVILTSTESIYFPWRETERRMVAENGGSRGLTEKERIEREFRFNQ